MLDLEPATRTLARLVEGVRDDQLDDPTPCVDTSLAAMLDHVDGLSIAFTAAAAKTPLPGGSQRSAADASRLGAGWRSRIPLRLTALAHVWRDEEAWTGMTEVGGVRLTGEAAGMFALDEVIVHGWDIAVASRQHPVWDPALVRTTYEFVRASANPDGAAGLFGPPVPVPDGAPLLDRLIGLTGRDPALSGSSHEPAPGR